MSFICNIVSEGTFECPILLVDNETLGDNAWFFVLILLLFMLYNYIVKLVIHTVNIQLFVQ